MELKTYTEWTPKELWEHEQLTFSAHIAIMFQLWLPITRSHRLVDLFDDLHQAACLG